MHIKAVSDLTGLTAKSIRYYETIKLVEPLRDASGYRIFRNRDLEKLRFIARSRNLGFSTEDCRELLTLSEDPNRASAKVKTIAKHHLNETKRKLDELAEMRAILEPLVQNCAGNNAPDCPIIDELAARRNRHLETTRSNDRQSK